MLQVATYYSKVVTILYLCDLWKFGFSKTTKHHTHNIIGEIARTHFGTLQTLKKEILWVLKSNFDLTVLSIMLSINN